MKKITEEQFTEALEAVVKERGEDYTYPTQDENPLYWEDGSCLYEVDGKPACIIGAAIAHLGGDVTKIGHQAVGPADAIFQSGLELDPSPEFKQAMNKAQSTQDQGYHWGHALERYRDFMGV